MLDPANRVVNWIEYFGDMSAKIDGCTLAESRGNEDKGDSYVPPDRPSEEQSLLQKDVDALKAQVAELQAAIVPKI